MRRPAVFAVCATNGLSPGTMTRSTRPSGLKANLGSEFSANLPAELCTAGRPRCFFKTKSEQLGAINGDLFGVLLLALHVWFPKESLPFVWSKTTRLGVIGSPNMGSTTSCHEKWSGPWLGQLR